MGISKSLFGAHAEMLYERNFQALLLATVLPPLGSTLISPILDSLIGAFGTSAADIGLIISVYTAPSIAVIPLAGVISDRFGRKPVLVPALVLFGLAGILITLTTDFRIVLALRFLQGIGFGGCMPIITTSIGDLYQASDETTAQGLRLAGAGLATTVLPFLSGVLVLIGWQYPFLMYAIAFPVAGIVFRWFDEPQSITSPPASGDPSADSRLDSFVLLARQPPVLLTIIGRGLPTFVWIAFITYNSLIVVRSMGGTALYAGVLFAIASLAFAAAGSQAGRLTDRFSGQFHPLLAANIFLFLGFVIFLFAPAVSIAAIGSLVVGTGFGLALSLYRSTVTGLTDDALRGSLVSVSEAFGRVVATLTPVLTGALIAILSLELGTVLAVQIAGIAAAIVGSGGGIACLILLGRDSAVWHRD